jgi:hypothetical protein
MVSTGDLHVNSLGDSVHHTSFLLHTNLPPTSYDPSSTGEDESENEGGRLGKWFVSKSLLYFLELPPTAQISTFCQESSPRSIVVVLSRFIHLLFSLSICSVVVTMLIQSMSSSMISGARFTFVTMPND